jgi:hypothetical protein
LPESRCALHQLTPHRGFKALKQMTKMNYLLLHKPELAIVTYRELLGYTKVGCPSLMRPRRNSRIEQRDS